VENNSKFNGDFCNTAFEEVLAKIYFDQETGVLDVSQGKIRKRFYFSQGEPFFSESNLSQENIIYNLLQQNRIDDQQYQQIYEKAKQEKKKTHLVLDELGLIASEEIALLLKRYTQEKFLDTFSWNQGDYRFVSNDKFLSRLPRVKLDFFHLLFDGIRLGKEAGSILKTMQQHTNYLVVRQESFSSLCDILQDAFLGVMDITIFIDDNTNLGRLLEKNTNAYMDISKQIYAMQVARMISFVDTSDKIASPPPEKVDSGNSKEDEVINSIATEFNHLQDADHYQVLGVSRDAGDEAIKDSYFALAKKYHTDAYSQYDLHEDTREMLDEIFSMVTVAYQQLSDEEKKKEYDTILDRKEKGLPLELNAVLQAETFFKKGMSLLQYGNHQAAENCFKEAIKLNNGEAEFHACLGWAKFLNSGSYLDDSIVQKVEEHLDCAIRMNPNLDLVYYYRGAMQTAMNKFDSARRNLKKALEMNPDNKEAQKELNRLTIMESKQKKKGFFTRLFGK